MYSSSEIFGKFCCNDPSYKANKEIIILSRPDKNIGEFMVEFAIKFCKMYGVELTGAVEYQEIDPFNKRISFKVQCSVKSYRQLYDGGRKYSLGSSNPTAYKKDIDRYEEKFGTRVCKDEKFEKSFWFTDSWDGHVRKFPTLKEAEAAAAKEYGTSVCINTNNPYGQMSEIVEFAKASGYMPS